LDVKIPALFVLPNVLAEPETHLGEAGR